MPDNLVIKSKQGVVRNSTLFLAGFAITFLPRLLTSFGVPKAINFAHFIIIPMVVIIAILTSKVKERKQISIIWELLFGIGLLLAIITASTLVNQAGIINLCLSFILLVEPFIFIIAILAVPVGSHNIQIITRWLLGFALFNLFLALAQSILLPLGIYPRPVGGTMQDNIVGVFGGGGGSAGNYISCTISLYFALYFLNGFKTVPAWIKVSTLLASVYQIQVSDSKQVLLAIFGGWFLLVILKFKDLRKILLYLILFILTAYVFFWAIRNVNIEFFAAFRNWIDRDIWGIDGEASRIKFAAFRLIPPYYKTPLNWLFGLGPGHSASRLGGWVLRDYESMLTPLGATVHPVTADFWQAIYSNYLPQESTIYFPMFTWVGIWGDLGFLGLGGYLYLCSIIWRRMCQDDLSKFLLLSTAIFGFILTQMEEPGQVLTVACLIGLQWHQRQIKWRSQHPMVNNSPQSQFNVKISKIKE
ncbi:hypothetical protein [Calothrix sp. 336/3]|uniref:hypothetical protein n=1 Tax=Calothrix sp. 336/3 TaxID=1337936 RepID=UPI0004E32C0A|nr:hypothetical protein [Calothrix sp. 336/3]AKG20943.1 hypothetical protein IJ00_06205 [Calothrix sp. 336/3]